MLSAILALDPLAKVIVVSGQGDKQNALRAVGAGAYDFLCKPVDMDELRLVLQRCVYVAELEQEYRAMQQSAAGRRLRGHARRESADAGGLRLHSQGGAHQRPGADSGRKRHRQGNGGAGAPSPERAERAARSSPSTATRSRRTCWRASSSATRRAPSPARTRSAKATSKPPQGARCSSTRSASCRRRVQVKLLRFLQEKRFQRVGGRQEIQSDARVIAATNSESAGVGRQREVSRGPVLPPGRGGRQGARAAGAGGRHQSWWRGHSCTAMASSTQRPV